MFSIELCTSVYLISNLYKSFVCGAIGSFLYRLFHSFGIFSPFETAQVVVEFNIDNYHFVILGILCGYLGSFMITVSGYLISLKKRTKIEIIQKYDHITL